MDCSVVICQLNTLETHTNSTLHTGHRWAPFSCRQIEHISKWWNVAKKKERKKSKRKTFIRKMSACYIHDENVQNSVNIHQADNFSLTNYYMTRFWLGFTFWNPSVVSYLSLLVSEQKKKLLLFSWHVPDPHSLKWIVDTKSIAQFVSVSIKLLSTLRTKNKSPCSKLTERDKLEVIFFLKKSRLVNFNRLLSTATRLNDIRCTLCYSPEVLLKAQSIFV